MKYNKGDQIKFEEDLADIIIDIIDIKDGIVTYNLTHKELINYKGKRPKFETHKTTKPIEYSYEAFRHDIYKDPFKAKTSHTNKYCYLGEDYKPEKCPAYSKWLSIIRDKRILSNEFRCYMTFKQWYESFNYTKEDKPMMIIFSDKYINSNTARLLPGKIANSIKTQLIKQPEYYQTNDGIYYVTYTIPLLNIKEKMRGKTKEYVKEIYMEKKYNSLIKLIDRFSEEYALNQIEKEMIIFWIDKWYQNKMGFYHDEEEKWLESRNRANKLEQEKGDN